MPSATVRAWDISSARVDAAWKLASPPAPLKHPGCLSTLHRELSPSPPNVAFVASPTTPQPHRNCPFYTSHPGGFILFDPQFVSVKAIGCADEGSASFVFLPIKANRTIPNPGLGTCHRIWFFAIPIPIPISKESSGGMLFPPFPLSPPPFPLH